MSMNKEAHGSATSAAVVLAAVNSSSILNPLMSPLVDPQACASAIANAAQSSFPEVLIQSNQVHGNWNCSNFILFGISNFT